MIKIRLVCVGKLKENYWREAVAEYQKRLSRFCALEICELPEKKGPREEAEEILRACRGYTVALAVEGRKCTSEGFAGSLKRLTDAGRELTFVIGSSCGLDESVKAAADERLSFSDLTFPHQLMRVIFLEQLYRAFMIGAGAEYHK